MTEARIDLRRFPLLGRKVALYVALALLCMILLVIAVGYRQGLLRQHAFLYLFAPDATGIVKGLPVKFLGFNIGNVSAMRIKGAEVEVELRITSEYMPHMPHGSHARLSRESLIGAAFIEIMPNRHADRRSMAANEVLRFERNVAPGELAEDLKRRIDPLIGSMKQTVDWINSPEGDLRRSLVLSGQIMGSAAQTIERVGDLALNANSATTGIRQSVDSVGDSVTRLANTSTAVISAEMPRIAASTTAAMQEVAAAARELGRTTSSTRERVDAVGERVNQTLSSAQALAADAGEITQVVKGSWPFNQAQGAPRTRTLPLDFSNQPLPWPDAPPLNEDKVR